MLHSKRDNVVPGVRALSDHLPPFSSFVLGYLHAFVLAFEIFCYIWIPDIQGGQDLRITCEWAVQFLALKPPAALS